MLAKQVWQLQYGELLLELNFILQKSKNKMFSTQGQDGFFLISIFKSQRKMLNRLERKYSWGAPGFADFKSFDLF